MDSEIKTWLYDNDKISDDLIWSIVINHLPKLKSEIQIMLEKEQSATE